MSGPNIRSVNEVVSLIESMGEKPLMLFRGQDRNDDLLPKIARKDPSKDTTEIEKQMLRELRRRAPLDPILSKTNDWDCLVYAQHYGMATRLLDWTSNSLVALWFSACNRDIINDGYLYILFVNDDLLLDKQKEKDPFNIGKTRVLKPNILDSRIAVQSAWFTAHRYSNSAQKFVPLKNNPDLKKEIIMKCIPGDCKEEILLTLDKLGINEESVFPGTNGMCKHMNYTFRHEI